MLSVAESGFATNRVLPSGVMAIAELVRFIGAVAPHGDADRIAMDAVSTTAVE